MDPDSVGFPALPSITRQRSGRRVVTVAGVPVPQNGFPIGGWAGSGTPEDPRRPRSPVVGVPVPDWIGQADWNQRHFPAADTPAESAQGSEPVPEPTAPAEAASAQDGGLDIEGSLDQESLRRYYLRPSSDVE